MWCNYDSKLKLFPFQRLTAVCDVHMPITRCLTTNVASNRVLMSTLWRFTAVGDTTTDVVLNLFTHLFHCVVSDWQLVIYVLYILYVRQYVEHVIILSYVKTNSDE